jgi:predicted amidohydrolase YtcJ
MNRAVRLSALSCALLAFACQESTPTADLILTNARVYTLDWGEPDAEGNPAADAPFDPEASWHPDAQAVAVAGDGILFVGSSADADVFRGPGTRIMDLNGATVIPGLIESHVHLVQLGQFLSQIDLVGVQTEEEAVALAEARASELEPGTWILGSGWDEGAWANHYPTMDLLSERVPDHPVYLRGLHGFAGWGNRMAFQLAEITAGTPEPAGGQVIRDVDGNPSGVLLNQATRLLEDAIPLPTVEETMEHVLAGLQVMAESGYVSIHEAGSDRRYQEAFERLEAEGRLPIRVYSMLAARDPELCEEWLARGPDDDAESMLRTRSVKAFYDAALGSRGAWLLEDYSDMPGQRGTGGAAYGFPADVVRRMMLGGFQAEIHAIGDAGNREALDFYQGVLAEDPGATALRNKVVHAQVVHPEDFPRFAQLNLIASMQPPHVAEDMDWAEDRVGPDRIRGAYAWRTMRRNGVRLIFNSDLPGSDWDIFYGLHTAITRTDKEGQPPGGWYPAQAMTPEEAVRGYTVWGAYAEFLDDYTGVIREGMWADLTIMDLDPFLVGSADPDALLGGRILGTVSRGRVLFEAGG